MKDPIEGLADHVISAQYQDMPANAIEAAKTYILDSFGVGLAGSTGPFIDELLKTFSDRNISGPAARVLGQSAKLTPSDAALMNGYQIHNSEFDCVHEKAVLHPMTVLLSALLADGDRRGGINGQTLIEASVLGVDVACNLGVACSTGLQFFRPATAGAFAAVAAIGRARNYDKETLLNAFSLVYSQLSGTMQAHTEGSPLLALQIGFNSRNALVACDLAENGLPGLEGVLEGPFGYFGLIERNGDIGSLLPSLGEVWRITEVAHKPFPSGRATHGIVDAIREFQSQKQINVDDINKVEAHVPSLTHHLIGRPVHNAMEVNYARLNGQYAASVMLQRGFIGIDDFTMDSIRDRTSVSLAEKVIISINDDPDPNALSPVDVVIHMKDGSLLTKRIETVYGNPKKPMTREAHLSKFRRNWAASATSLSEQDGEKMIDLTDNLEQLADIRELIDLATG